MKIYLFIWMCISSALVAKVVPHSQMSDVMPYFENANSDTLAVFDIDLVLIQPDEPAFQMPNMKKYRTIARELMLAIPAVKREVCFTLMTTEYPSILVDERMPAYIKQIQAQNISTMALTAHYSGPFENIPNLEIWKRERLRQWNIDFSLCSPTQKDIEFQEVNAYRNRFPIYTKGILFTNGPAISKGEMLVKFLKAADIAPTKIVFLDDREENVQNAEEWLQKEFPHIEYIGVWYLGALAYPSKIISEEEFVAKWQQTISQAMLIN